MPTLPPPSLAASLAPVVLTAGLRGLDTPVHAFIGLEVDAPNGRFLLTHAALLRALQGVLPRRGGVSVLGLAADASGAWVARLTMTPPAPSIEASIERSIERSIEPHDVTVTLAPARLTWSDGALCVVAGTPDALGGQARRAATQLLVALAQLFGGSAPGAWAWRGGVPPGLRRDGEWMEWTARVHDHAGLPAWVTAPTPTALAITITPTGTWFTLAPGPAPEATLGAVLAVVEERLAPPLAGPSAGP